MELREKIKAITLEISAGNLLYEEGADQIFATLMEHYKGGGLSNEELSLIITRFRNSIMLWSEKMEMITEVAQAQHLADSLNREADLIQSKKDERVKTLLDMVKIFQDSEHWAFGMFNISHGEWVKGKSVMFGEDVLSEHEKLELKSYETEKYKQPIDWQALKDGEKN